MVKLETDDSAKEQFIQVQVAMFTEADVDKDGLLNL